MLLSSFKKVILLRSLSLSLSLSFIPTHPSTHTHTHTHTQVMIEYFSFVDELELAHVIGHVYDTCMLYLRQLMNTYVHEQTQG